MYRTMVADKTRKDAANEDSYLGMVGHNNLKDGIYPAMIQITLRKTDNSSRNSLTSVVLLSSCLRTYIVMWHLMLRNSGRLERLS